MRVLNTRPVKSSEYDISTSPRERVSKVGFAAVTRLRNNAVKNICNAQGESQHFTYSIATKIFE